MKVVDARGVEIAAGDSCVYGFGVGRSIAMCEGVVVGEEHLPGQGFDGPTSVSLTASGRVRVRVIRRSYHDGEKPVVDVAPDRLVVLKPEWTGLGDLMTGPALPPSPLPTQADKNRVELQSRVELYKARAQSMRDGGEAPLWAYEELCRCGEAHWEGGDFGVRVPCPRTTAAAARAQALAWYESEVARYKEKLDAEAA